MIHLFMLMQKSQVYKNKTYVKYYEIFRWKYTLTQNWILSVVDQAVGLKEFSNITVPHLYKDINRIVQKHQALKIKS